MHSCYETIGAEDTAALAAFSAAFYREDLPEISGSGVNGNP
jgi:aspartyl aminopeptidase